jgi:hypothetical protein
MDSGMGGTVPVRERRKPERSALHLAQRGDLETILAGADEGSGTRSRASSGANCAASPTAAS